jgi:hypothetical protein
VLWVGEWAFQPGRLDAEIVRMEESASSTVLPLAVAPRPQPRHLLLISASLAVGIGTSIAAAVYVLLATHAIANYDDRFVYELNGGLFTAVQVGVYVIATAVVVGASYLAVRSVRAAKGSSRRRLAVLVGILFGLLFPIVPSYAADKAMTWGSTHSAGAKKARADARAWLARYRQAPIPFDVGGMSAAPQLAGQVLTVASFGAGWYPEFTPNPAETRFPPSSSGAVLRVRSMLTKSHWTGRYWALDVNFTEYMTVYSTPSDARSYAATLLRHTATPTSSAVANGPVKHVRVDGVDVAEYASGISSKPLHPRAVIVRGNTVWFLRYEPFSSAVAPVPGFDAVVRMAVQVTRPDNSQP